MSSVLGETKCAMPVTVRTLRCLAITAKPAVSLLTTFCLYSRSVSRVIFGLPKSIPKVLACAASSMTAAACSNALEGMQPTLRQTPPRLG